MSVPGVLTPCSHFAYLQVWCGRKQPEGCVSAGRLCRWGRRMGRSWFEPHHNLKSPGMVLFIQCQICVTIYPITFNLCTYWHGYSCAAYRTEHFILGHYFHLIAYTSPFSHMATCGQSLAHSSRIIPRCTASRAVITSFISDAVIVISLTPPAHSRSPARPIPGYLGYVCASLWNTGFERAGAGEVELPEG